MVSFSKGGRKLQQKQGALPLCPVIILWSIHKKRIGSIKYKNEFNSKCKYRKTASVRLGVNNRTSTIAGTSAGNPAAEHANRENEKSKVKKRFKIARSAG